MTSSSASSSSKTQLEASQARRHQLYQGGRQRGQDSKMKRGGGKQQQISKYFAAAALPEVEHDEGAAGQAGQAACRPIKVVPTVPRAQRSGSPISVLSSGSEDGAAAASAVAGTAPVVVAAPAAAPVALPATAHSAAATAAQAVKQGALKGTLVALDAVSDDDVGGAQDGLGDGGKLTPLEQQWQELKADNPDLLLCVQCGYKYHMLGPDAAAGAKVLSITAFRSRGKSLAQSSFPVQRLGVHVRRLVEAGHLVGVVSQMETAALKKTSKTKSKVFTRKLTAVYSKATLLEDDMLQLASTATSRPAVGGPSAPKLNRWFGKRSGSAAAAPAPGPAADRDSGDDDRGEAEEAEAEEEAAEAGDGVDDTDERFIVAVWELDSREQQCVAEGGGKWYLGEPRPSAPSVQLGVVAVEVRSGVVRWDSFPDSARREKLGSCLSSLRPAEVLLPGPTMSRESEKYVERLVGSGARVERVLAEDNSYAAATKVCSDFYSRACPEMLDAALALPRAVVPALACMIRHLKRFKLELALCAPGALSGKAGTRDEPEFLALGPEVLTDLHLLPAAGAAGARDRGAAFSIWNLLASHARTPMGARRLREWVRRPLRAAAAVQERQQAVRELIEANKGLGRSGRGRFAALDDALQALKRKDLDHAREKLVHARCDPAQFVALLDQFAAVASAVAGASGGPKPDPAPAALLARTLQPTPCEALSARIEAALGSISREAALRNDLEQLFRDASAFPGPWAVKGELKLLEEALEAQLASVRQVLDRPALTFSTLRTGVSSTLEYLIELPLATAVPRSWSEVSRTKRVVRYVTPEVEALLEQRARRREELAAACREAWRELCESFSAANRESLVRLCSSVADYDALAALAVAGSAPGFCIPEVEEASGAFLLAADLAHPLIEDCVPNDVCLGAPSAAASAAFAAAHPSWAGPGPRVQIVMGPNLGGKSSYCRQAAVCVVLAQMGGLVPASACRVGMFDAVLTRMGVKDDQMNAMSTFMVEMRQTAAILNEATSRTLCIADEVGRGTSSFDGLAVATAVLRYLCNDLQCPCFFITHYTSLAGLIDEVGDAATLGALNLSYHSEQQGDVTFLYKAVRGVSHESYGMNVARLAGIPEAILDEARRVSRRAKGREDD